MNICFAPIHRKMNSIIQLYQYKERIVVSHCCHCFIQPQLLRFTQGILQLIKNFYQIIPTRRRSVKIPPTRLYKQKLPARSPIRQFCALILNTPRPAQRGETNTQHAATKTKRARRAFIHQSAAIFPRCGKEEALYSRAGIMSRMLSLSLSRPAKTAAAFET